MITVEGARNLLANPTAELTPLERGLLGDVITLTERLERIRRLFAGGPDTPCRTRWRADTSLSPGLRIPDVECVEVPMEDLREALDNEPHDGYTKAHEPETERQTPEDHQRELKAWGATSVSPVAGD